MQHHAPGLADHRAAGAPYRGELLALALDMATRLLPAFQSKSGVPYAWVRQPQLQQQSEVVLGR